ncbi:MAG: hypothetical protein ACRDRA_18085 [Pseudonocardiaceae bacterium]
MDTTRPSPYGRRRTATWRTTARSPADRTRSHRADYDIATTDLNESAPTDQDTAGNDDRDRAGQTKQIGTADRAANATATTTEKDRSDRTENRSTGRAGPAAVTADPVAGNHRAAREPGAPRHAVIQFRAARRPLEDGDTSAADGPAAPGGEAGLGGDAGGAWTVIGVITSQMVLITALLYYLGWVRTHSFLGYFGVDPSMAGYGTADYVLRSITVAFPPFIHGAFTALALLGLHRLVVHRWCRERRTLQWLVRTVHAAGLALGTVVLTGVLLPNQIGAPLGVLLPLLLIAAVSLLGYVTHLRSRYPNSLPSNGSRQAVCSSRTYTSLTLLALGLVAAVWALSLYGDQVGTGAATDMADHLSEQRDITIYSMERIAIAGPGVVSAEITQPGTKYHYQYTGLRLLLHSPEGYLLLPAGWRHGEDRIFLLRDDDTIRVDITAR